MASDLFELKRPHDFSGYRYVHSSLARPNVLCDVLKYFINQLISDVYLETQVEMGSIFDFFFDTRCGKSRLSANSCKKYHSKLEIGLFRVMLRLF